MWGVYVQQYLDILLLIFNDNINNNMINNVEINDIK